MTSDPQDLGAPDLANRAWDPFWEVVHRAPAAGALPHRGQRHRDDVLRPVPVGVAPDEHQARHRRHAAVHRQRARGHQRDPVGHVRPPPRPARWCRSRAASAGSRSSSRRSTTRCPRTRRASSAKLKKMPSEYFRSNLYATFWFENNRNKLPDLIEAVGEDSILFETDFPHPTCLYPKPLESGGGRRWRRSPPETQQQDHRRERPQALPALNARRRCRGHDRALDRRPAGRRHLGTDRRPSSTRRGACRPAEVALASAAEVDDAVKVAVDASRRVGRVVAEPARRRCCSACASCSTRTATTWPRSSPASTARCSTDAQGEVARGLESVEFACGIPHLLKGSHSSRGVDAASTCTRCSQPVGVVAGITPFNFPVMVPLWMLANASRAATRSC